MIQVTLGLWANAITKGRGGYQPSARAVYSIYFSNFFGLPHYVSAYQ
jgi:hypothetical protein